MNLRLRIDPRSDSPIYRQISEQIASMVEAGKLRRGEHLPPERELALQLKIARGTVKKAYESLVQQRYI
ncbi:MAG: GntR family transcriptional regulator, partial [Candidatus Riflebacteria bacterium]|nr:GntR family transcriptional regulator [Candidatus Riflebacteria bacterium]